MRYDYFETHLRLTEMSRREALRLAARAGTAGAVAAMGANTLMRGVAFADPETSEDSDADVAPESHRPPGRFTDEMFDVAAVLAGAWDDTAFYHRGDQRGTFNEITPRKTARALRLLDPGKAVVTYNLGELLFNGFPAYVTIPPRIYDQRLIVLGYEPPAGFEGYLQGAQPAGPNQLSGHEERFRIPDEPDLPEAARPFTYTYQIATQLDNLNHIGVGPVFYGGHRGPDIAETWGTNRLGNENMGPIVTRGIVLDILGLKLEQGATDDISQAGNGAPLLRDNYRITLEDIEAAMRRERIRRIERGDVVLFRTGWNQLVDPKDPNNPDEFPLDPATTHPLHPDHRRYLAQEPGIYLREARWLASRRPAIVGGDAWGLEVVDPEVTQGNAFPCHQELLTHHGVRIGEGMLTDGLVQDGIYEFVYIVTPQYALGATAGSTPPAALGQPRRHHDRHDGRDGGKG